MECHSEHSAVTPVQPPERLAPYSRDQLSIIAAFVLKIKSFPPYSSIFFPFFPPVMPSLFHLFTAAQAAFLRRPKRRRSKTPFAGLTRTFFPMKAADLRAAKKGRVCAPEVLPGQRPAITLPKSIPEAKHQIRYSAEEPLMLPTTSPAAYSPGIGCSLTSITSRLFVTFTPPSVVA